MPVFDATDVREDDVERTRYLPGWYLTNLGKYEEARNPDRFVFYWTVATGPFKGQNIIDTVSDFRVMHDAKDALEQKKRFFLRMKRLDLMKEGDFGKKLDIDPRIALGRQIVVHMVFREWVSKDGKPGEGVQPEYRGFHKLDSPEIPPTERVKLGLPLLPGQSPDDDGGKAAKEASKAGAGDSAAKGRGGKFDPKSPNFDPTEI